MSAVQLIIFATLEKRLNEYGEYLIMGLHHKLSPFALVWPWIPIVEQWFLSSIPKAIYDATLWRGILPIHSALF